MEAPRTQRLMGTNTWLTDMDGVLVREESAIAGAARLLELWRERAQRFLVLTNNSMYTPRDLSARLARSGLNVRESELWTSALATAEFLREQAAGHRAYVIGEAGLTTAMHEAGFVLTDTDCDYVVLGETRTYSFEAITKAVRLIDGGARFISTNPDTTGPSPQGPLPATGAVAAMISAATKTNKQPYVVGKPNPMMFRSALNRIKAHSETTAMLGDRMDTDIIAGMEAGLSTLLVLSGVTKREQVEQFPFRPTAVMESVQDLVNLLEMPGPDGSSDG